MAKKQPDWEAIEHACRAGMLSLRAMAEQFGSKKSTIRSRVSKNGWKMDLTAQVKAATTAAQAADKADEALNRVSP